jgi:hypothetical protein
VSSPIDAALLAELKTLNESFLTETLTITDTAQTDDGPVASAPRDVLGQFWTLRGDEAGEDQIRMTGAHRAEFPSTTTIAPTATITRANGEIYAVKFVFPIGTYSTSRIVGLEDA